MVSAGAGGTALASESHRRSIARSLVGPPRSRALFESADVRHLSVQRGFEHAPDEPDDRLFTVLAVKR